VSTAGEQSVGDGRATTTRRRVIRGAGGVAGVGAVTLLATACGQGQSGAGTTAPSAVSGQITFMSRDAGSDLEPYKQGIALFTGKQSRVKVQHDIVTGNFEQKLQTVFAGGTAPDVSYMHSQNIPTFVVNGMVDSLEPFVRKEKGVLDGLLPTAVDSYRWKGAVSGVPDVATSLVMFINRPLFTRAGLPFPTEKWTWNDYLATAQKISNDGRADGVFGAVDYNGGFPRLTALWQNNGDILNKDRNAVVVDRPEALEAFSWIADQMLKTKVLASPADLQGRGAEQFFLDGKAAMIPIISSRMGTVAKGAQFETEVVHLPQGRTRVTRVACGGVAMIKGTKSPDASWELLKFWATDEFQWLISKAGGIIFPAHKKVAESPELFAGGPFPRSPRVTVDAMAYARTEAYTVRYPEMITALNKELDTVWQAQSSVKDALTRAKAAIDPILADALSQIK
jgi:multiple sugar transport system substrate-binding protein